MDAVGAMDYKDVAYQHHNTRWTRRDGCRLLAKVRAAGSNPVVRCIQPPASLLANRLARSRAELDPVSARLGYSLTS